MDKIPLPAVIRVKLSPNSPLLLVGIASAFSTSLTSVDLSPCMLKVIHVSVLFVFFRDTLSVLLLGTLILDNNYIKPIDLTDFKSLDPGDCDLKDHTYLFELLGSMSHLKRFETIFFEGDFCLFGTKFRQSLGFLDTLRTLRFVFEIVFTREMEKILHAGCFGWSTPRSVTLTLVPKLGVVGKNWSMGEMEQLHDKAPQVGAHLEFVWE